MVVLRVLVAMVVPVLTVTPRLLMVAMVVPVGTRV
jgi:hypothetical protein